MPHDQTVARLWANAGSLALTALADIAPDRVQKILEDLLRAHDQGDLEPLVEALRRSPWYGAIDGAITEQAIANVRRA